MSQSSVGEHVQRGDSAGDSHIDAVNHVPMINKCPHRVVYGRSASASLLGRAAQWSASQADW